MAKWGVLAVNQGKLPILCPSQLGKRVSLEDLCDVASQGYRVEYRLLMHQHVEKLARLSDGTQRGRCSYQIR